MFLGAFIAQSEKPPSDGEVLHSLLSNKYNEVKMFIINKKFEGTVSEFDPNTPVVFTLYTDLLLQVTVDDRLP